MHSERGLARIDPLEAITSATNSSGHSNSNPVIRITSASKTMLGACHPSPLLMRRWSQGPPCPETSIGNLEAAALDSGLRAESVSAENGRRCGGMPWLHLRRTSQRSAETRPGGGGLGGWDLGVGQAGVVVDGAVTRARGVRPTSGSASGSPVAYHVRSAGSPTLVEPTTAGWRERLPTPRCTSGAAWRRVPS